MQCASIEFARNVLHLEGAHSAEFDGKTAHPIISLLDAQQKVVKKGGTMRLGAYPCHLVEETKAWQAYQSGEIRERHRHRYEFNNKFRAKFEANGMVFSGLSPDGQLVEMIELAGHPWFVACQFHPEFKSKPVQPHPLFRDFVEAATRDLSPKSKRLSGEMVKKV